MKRFLTFAVIALIGIAASAQPAPMPMPETVSVTGTGRASVVPDRITFTVGVQTVSNAVEDAVNENNRKVAAVIAALKKAGAADKDIRTSNFAIYPNQDYTQGQLPRILGYTVSNNITVTKEKIADAGKLLQAAVSSGVNTSSGLQFEVSDPSKGRDTGLRAAYDDARAKAALVAQAAGRTLGRAMTIEEGARTQPPPQPYPRAMAMKAEASVSEIPIEGGTQENVYTISVTFELR